MSARLGLINKQYKGAVQGLVASTQTLDKGIVGVKGSTLLTQISYIISTYSFLHQHWFLCCSLHFKKS